VRVNQARGQGCRCRLGSIKRASRRGKMHRNKKEPPKKKKPRRPCEKEDGNLGLAITVFRRRRQ